MSLVKILGFEYVTLNQSFSKIYWTEITKIIRHTYGYYKIEDSETVKEALHELLSYLLECFKEVVEKNRCVAFLLFVHRIHESSVLLSQAVQSREDKQINGLSEQDIKEVPSIRRVLKLIMEELLVESFDEEISEELIIKSQSSSSNVTTLEELLYIGTHALEIIEQINLASLFKKSIALKADRKYPLTIYTNSPYNHILETIKTNMCNYENNYYLEANDKLDNGLKDAFCVNLEIFKDSLPQGLGSFIVPKVDYLNEQNFSSCSRENVDMFYRGLTLNHSNKLPLEISFLKMQDNNRLMYRPIIEFKDKRGNDYWILGLGKTIESNHALRSNAILWGKLPREWKEDEKLGSFEKEMEEHREEVMMDRVVNIIGKYNLKYSRDIKSFFNSSGQGLKINTVGLGQIDLIFLNEQERIIYVCECKNNRPRFDTYNWKIDYDQFTNASKKRNYERQLNNKYEWVSNNKKVVQEHFNYMLNESFNFEDWSVKGLFLLMAPSIYKYDGLFLVLTLSDLVEFIENDFDYRYGTMRFERKDGSFYEIEYPYFKNMNKLVEEGIL